MVSGIIPDQLIMVRCSSCSGSMGYAYPDIYQAGKAWNNRVTPLGRNITATEVQQRMELYSGKLEKCLAWIDKWTQIYECRCEMPAHISCLRCTGKALLEEIKNG